MLGEPMDEPQSKPKSVRIPPLGLEGLLVVPHRAAGVVIFAHGSGRRSVRNNEVAAELRQAGLATLLLDLLRPEEEAARANVFDIELLASRLAAWAQSEPRLSSDVGGSLSGGG
jgi:putative phosphoribosyl transferase